MILQADPSATAAPTQAQIDVFHRDGFLPVGMVLEAGEIQALRMEYDRVFAQARASDSYRNLSIAEAAHVDEPANPLQMLQIMQVCERSLPFRRLLFHERVLSVVRAVIGPNVMLFHDQALFKPARTGGEVSWHQDNAYWRCRPANLVSCWLTLDDAESDNGAMQLIPGSHLCPSHHDRSARSGAQLQAPAVDTARAVVVPLPAGGCLFHHCQTLHYTAPNTTDRQRRAFIMHFMPFGTADADGAIMRPSFARPVVSMG